MNIELSLAFIIGAIIGGGITFKLLPGFLKSIFRETARDELSEIQNEISDDNKQNEDDLSKRLEALNTAIIKVTLGTFDPIPTSCRTINYPFLQFIIISCIKIV